MDYKIIISNDAVADTHEAYFYYEKQQPKLGERFLDELSFFYEKIKNHPTYYSFVSQENTIRSIALKKFPYKIIYEVSKEELYVFAIYHFSRGPENLSKRL